MTNKVFVVLVVIVLASAAVGPLFGKEKDKATIQKEEKVVAQREAKSVKRQILTRYDINGRPVNQSQDSKGHHRVVGTVTLSSGVDTVTLNTSVVNGQQDVTFTSQTTYHGRAWSLSLADRANTYSVLPLTGSKFVVVSSDNTDAATVRYEVEGE